MKLSSLIRWCAIATVAVGIGILIGKAVPKRSTTPVAAATTQPAVEQPATEQPATQGSSVILHFVKNPEPVPTFSVTSFDGKTLNPAEWKGKVVILNFWATWCTPCRYEIPELSELQKEFQGKLQVIGLSVDDAPPKLVKDFVKQIGFDYPVAMASEKLQDKFGGILALPTSFVINQDGRVVQKHTGLVAPAYYAKEIGYLVGKPVDVKVESFVDEGQVFPANAKNAKSLPGVDMSHLTAAQRKAALKQMNQVRCDCGCDYTVAQCRLLDPGCPNSKALAEKIVKQVASGAKSLIPPKGTTL